MTPKEAFFDWVVNRCTTRFSTARDEYAKSAWLEATRQAYEDAARICDEHARSYGAINESVTTEYRMKDYAIEGAIRSVQEAIRQRLMDKIGISNDP